MMEKENNRFSTFDRPGSYHNRINRGLVELNALPPIKDRTRLIIGDALAIASWSSSLKGDSLLMSFDPVTHDAMGLQLLSEAWAAAGRNPGGITNLVTPWLEAGAKLGLGANDPNNMDLVEASLG